MYAKKEAGVRNKINRTYLTRIFIFHYARYVEGLEHLKRSLIERHSALGKELVINCPMEDIDYCAAET